EGVERSTPSVVWMKAIVPLQAKECCCLDRHKIALEDETDLIVQVLDHSTWHRAQVAVIIRQMGLSPPVLSGWKYMRKGNSWSPWYEYPKHPITHLTHPTHFTTLRDHVPARSR